MEHGSKDIAFYVQKHTAHWTVVITSLLVRDRPLGAPAYVKRVYWCVTRAHGRGCCLFVCLVNMLQWDNLDDYYDYQYIGHRDSSPSKGLRGYMPL